MMGIKEGNLRNCIRHYLYYPKLTKYNGHYIWIKDTVGTSIGDGRWWRSLVTSTSLTIFEMWCRSWLFCYHNFLLVLGQRCGPCSITQWTRIKFSFRIKTSFSTIFAAPMFACIHFDSICLIKGVAAKWTTCVHHFLRRTFLGTPCRWRMKFLRNHLVPVVRNLNQWYRWIHYWTTIDQFQSEVRCSVLYQFLR